MDSCAGQQGWLFQHRRGTISFFPEPCCKIQTCVLVWASQYCRCYTDTMPGPQTRMLERVMLSLDNHNQQDRLPVSSFVPQNALSAAHSKIVGTYASLNMFGYSRTPDLLLSVNLMACILSVQLGRFLALAKTSFVPLAPGTAPSLACIWVELLQAVQC